MIKAPFHWERDADLAYRILDANSIHVATIDPGMPVACQEASARAITNALNSQTPRPLRRMKTSSGSVHDRAGALLLYLFDRSLAHCASSSASLISDAVRGLFTDSIERTSLDAGLRLPKRGPFQILTSASSCFTNPNTGVDSCPLQQ